MHWGGKPEPTLRQALLNAAQRFEADKEKELLGLRSELDAAKLKLAEEVVAGAARDRKDKVLLALWAVTLCRYSSARS